MKIVACPVVVFLLLCFLKISLPAQTLVNRVGVDSLSNRAPLFTGTSYQAAAFDAATGLYVAIGQYYDTLGTVAAVVNIDTFGNNNWVSIYTYNTHPQNYITNLRYKSGYVYTTGFIIDSATGLSSILTVKLDATTGDTVFTRIYRGSYAGNDIGATLLIDDSLNIYVCGTEQMGVSDYRMALLKYDNAGNLLWSNGYDSTGLYSGAVGMVLNSGSNIVITGFSGTSYTQSNFVTAWFSLGGARLSVAISPNTSGIISQPVAILGYRASNVVVVGTASTGGGNSQIKALEYDSTFTQIAVRTFGDSNSVITASGASNDDDGHLVFGGTAANASGGKDVFVVCMQQLTSGLNLNADTVLWTKRVSAPNAANENSAAAITTDNSGNAIAVGRLYNGSKFSINTIALSINNGGAMQWAKTYDAGGSYNAGTSVVVDASNNVYTFGESIAGVDTTYEIVEYQTLPISTSIISDTSGNPLYVQGNLIIRFSPSVLNLDVVNNNGIIYGTPEQILTSGFDAAFESVLGNLGVDGKNCYLQKLAPNYYTWDTTLISKIGDTVKIPPFWSSFLLMYGGGANERQVRDGLHTLYPNIKYVHLNYLGNMSCDCSTTCADDPHYASQYGLFNDSTGTYAHGGVNAEGAWVLETGKSFVKVGVFDTGIEWLHPDFITDSAVQTSKVVGGYDYEYQPGFLLYNETDNGGDFYGHGTAVAGIIGALRNNNTGIAGIAGGNWCNSPSLDSSGVSLYSFGVSNYNGPTVTPFSSAIILAMNDALSNRTDINYSDMDILNFSDAINVADPDSFQEFKEKFYYAFRLGKIVVASRGNSQIHSEGNATVYPACFNDDWVLCVGGSDYHGLFAPYLDPTSQGSLYGYPIDVVAPYYGAMNQTTTIPNSYEAFSGTSASAPYGSGLAALLLSHLNNPTGAPDPKNLAPEDVEQIIQQTTYFNPTSTSAPYSDSIGWGRIDMGAAMKMADTTHAHLLHFNSISTSATTHLFQISASISIQLTDNVPNDTIQAGNYIAELWKYSATVHHNLTLAPGESVLGSWTRSSSSNSYPMYDSSSGNYQLEPYEKAYIDSTILPDSSNATVYGYFYKLKDTLGNFIKWIPQDPNDTAMLPKLSYTIYLDTLHYVPIPTQVTSITKEFSVSAYPNPASDWLHVNLSSNNNEFYNIQILDVLGHPVSPLFVGKTSFLSENYNIRNLESGMYFLQASSANNNETIKFSVLK